MFCLLSLFMFFPLNALEWQDLQTAPLEQIQIRGFLYETADKKLILSSQPNLKSCCVNKNDIPHIYVNQLQQPLSLNSALTLEGRLQKDQFHHYFLENAALVPEKKENSLLILLTLSFLLITISVTVLFFRR